MVKAQHLTKDEELRLGAMVQAMVQAKETLKDDSLKQKEIRSLRQIIIQGEDAVARLVEANTGLVWNQAKKFKSKYPSAPPLEDLVQEGMAGLVTAIMRYAPERNNKLSTVATYWIFQSITRNTNKTARLVRLPENRVTDYTKITRLRNKYIAEGLSKAESDEKIMNDLNLTKNDLFVINGAASNHASLNRTIDEDSDKELIEIVLDGTAESAESLVLQDATFQILIDKLSELGEMEREIVLSHFSMDNVPGYTPTSSKEIKEKYNLSASRHKRILTLALEEINKDMKELDLSFEDFINQD